MKHLFLIATLCLLCLPTRAQKVIDEYGNQLMPLKKAASYNYSHLWQLDTVTYQHGDRILGFIGNDFQRLYMVFLSVSKDSLNPLQYKVSGKSMVKGNVCNFTGTLTIDSLLYNKSGDCDLDGQLGTLLGSYKLSESTDQQHTGVFEGRFLTWFLWKSLDFWEGCGDWTGNNQFTGKWTSYATHKSKKCCWGDKRIPADFPDAGSGDFWPNPKEAPSWASYQAEEDKYLEAYYSVYDKYFPNSPNTTSQELKRQGVIKKLMMKKQKSWWEE